jgi:hypothetical protein
MAIDAPKDGAVRDLGHREPGADSAACALLVGLASVSPYREAIAALNEVAYVEADESGTATRVA